MTEVVFTPQPPQDVKMQAYSSQPAASHRRKIHDPILSEEGSTMGAFI
jgi:hypothetical protein